MFVWIEVGLPGAGQKKTCGNQSLLLPYRSRGDVGYPSYTGDKLKSLVLVEAPSLPNHLASSFFYSLYIWIYVQGELGSGNLTVIVADKVLCLGLRVAQRRFAWAPGCLPQRGQHGEIKIRAPSLFFYFSLQLRYLDVLTEMQALYVIHMCSVAP